MLGQLPFEIDFEIAAVVIFIITIFYTYSGRNLPNFINQIYKLMLVVAFATTVFKLIAVLSISYHEYIPVEVNYAILYVYLLLQNMMTPIWFFYVYTLTAEKKRDEVFAVFLIPSVIILLCFLVTPMTEYLFYLHKDGSYGFGPGRNLLFICAFIYLIASLIMTIRHRKNLNKRQCFAIGFLIFSIMAAYIIHVLRYPVLIIGFVTAISCLMMYISFQNPDEQMDYATGIFNRTAAISMISDYLKQNHSFYMVVLAIDQFRYINEKYGFDMGDSLLRSISKYLMEVIPNGVYRMDWDNIAIIFDQDLIQTEAVIEEIQSRFRREWNVGEDKVRISTCICCISCPQDAKTVTEVLDTINNTINDAKEIGGGTIIYANEHIENREKKISELEEQKRLLENISKEAEAARIEAERADQTKSIFLANVSHEIRTPMNAILGMTQLVLRDNVSNQVREHVENIQCAGESLLDIINDILDISKIESGKLEIVNERYFLSSILHDITNMICSRMMEKKVEFLLEIDNTLPNELIGDELRIRQILLNLLTNAIKFTVKGHVRLYVKGEVDGDILHLNFAVEDTGFGIKEENLGRLFENFARFDDIKTREIEGTGLGLSICKQLIDLMNGEISVESEYDKGSTFYIHIKQKIFDNSPLIEITEKELLKPLVILQNEEDTQMMHVLNKLGINATYEEEGKEVWLLLKNVAFSHVFIPNLVYKKRKAFVEELSKRTKVIVITEFGEYLDPFTNLSIIQKPLYCLNVGEALHGFSQMKDKKNQHETFIAPEAKVLVVDDNMVNLQVAEGLLKTYQMQITRALSGRECLALMESKEYDLIFLDHMMPDMDGVETLTKIREMKDEYYKTVKVIALTANAIRGIREMFLQKGFNDYISKPIDIGRLDEVIRRNLPEALIKRKKATWQMNEETFPYEIPNVDTKIGVHYCSGSVEQYFNLLRIVMTEGRTKPPMLREYIETNNIKSYMVEVHALKSVAASVGAKELSHLAKWHEEEAKAENYEFVQTRGEELLIKYQQFLDSIEEVLALQKEEEDAIEIRRSLSLEEVEHELLEIHKLVEHYEDEEALSRLNDLLCVNLTANTRKKVMDAFHALQEFDYNLARKILI